MKKRLKHKDGFEDVVKAMRKGNRDAEMALLGPGFHSKHSVHKSANTYSRKEKHKARFDNDSPCVSFFCLAYLTTAAPQKRRIFFFVTAKIPMK